MSRAELERLINVFNNRSNTQIGLDKDVAGFRVTIVSSDNPNIVRRNIGPRGTAKTVAIFLEGMIETLDLQERN